MNDGTCVDGDNSYVCQCKPGYTGTRCEVDINECNISKTNCNVNADCTDTPGSFECICHTGYTGDGVTCIDIGDECAENKDNCHVHAGSFECSCHTGSTGDGVRCTDIVECAENKQLSR